MKSKYLSGIHFIINIVYSWNERIGEHIMEIESVMKIILKHRSGRERLDE